MTKLRTLSSFPGVYTRLSKKRKLSNENYDICYEIYYSDDEGIIKYEKIGWASEGITLEKAVEKRKEYLNHKKKLKEEKKKVQSSSKHRQVKRIKTRYAGVYVRESYRRLGLDGKPDKCYDIVWHIGNGKYRWEKIGWKSEGYDLTDAVRIRAERVRQHRHPEFFTTAKDLTLDESWALYGDRQLPNLKESGKFRERYKKHLQKKFGNWKLSEIKTFDVDGFKNSLFEKGLSEARVKLILGDLRRIIRKMIEWEFYTGPIPTFHMPKVQNERLRYFSIQETKDYLLELILYDCDMYYIAKIEAYSGLRLDDILSLSKFDIDLQKKIIYTDGKGGRHETYIADGIIQDIMYLMKRTSQYLFSDKNGNRYSSKYMSNKFSRYISCTNINKGITDKKYKYVFHSGRHFFGSLLAEEGVSLYTIQKIMGHKDSRTTQRYAKFSSNSKRKALHKLDESMERPNEENSN